MVFFELSVTPTDINFSAKFKERKVSAMHSSDIKFIRKRDGRLEAFDPQKIEHAIIAAVKSVGGDDVQKAQEITRQMVSFLEVV